MDNKRRLRGYQHHQQRRVTLFHYPSPPNLHTSQTVDLGGQWCPRPTSLVQAEKTKAEAQRGKTFPSSQGRAEAAQNFGTPPHLHFHLENPSPSYPARDSSTLAGVYFWRSDLPLEWGRCTAGKLGRRCQRGGGLPRQGLPRDLPQIV